MEGIELTNDEGHTALMLAALHGKKECCALLVKYGARIHATNAADGKTARQYCAAKNFRAMVEWFDRGCQDERESSEDEEEIQDPNAVEGESATARSRRLRREKEAKEAGTAHAVKKESEEHAEEEQEVIYVADADDKKPARWPEVIKALESAETVQQTQKEVNCIKLEEDESAVDPGLWRCGFAFRVQLQMRKGVVTALPHKLERFRQLDTLILSHNSLSTLPDAITYCTQLRVLQLDDNDISVLPAPDVWAPIKGLQSVDLSSNQLHTAELAKMQGTLGAKLVSLKVDGNQLEELPLEWASLKLLQHLSASHNQLETLPQHLGLLKQLEFLNVENNAIEEIPLGMSQLSDKKLKEVNFKSNPLVDPRCKRILEREKLPVKPLLAHLKKMQKQGGGKKKKAAAAAAAAEAVAATDEKLTALELRERITQIYKHKNAEKLADVPKLMSKYRGKEEALYAAMLKKYQVDERSFFQHMDLDGDEGGDDEEDAQDHGGDVGGDDGHAAAAREGQQAERGAPAPSSTRAEQDMPQATDKDRPSKFDATEIKERAIFIYERKNPPYLERVPKLMIKFRGREQAFYRALLRKYEVAESFFSELYSDEEGGGTGSEWHREEGAPAASGDKDTAAALERDNGEVTDGEGTGVGAGADGDRPGEEAAAEAECAREQRFSKLSAKDIQKLVTKVYAEKNPDKQGDVPKLMEKYAGRETTLYEAICKKYNIDLAQKEKIDPAERARREREQRKVQQAELDVAVQLENARKMDEDERLEAKLEKLQAEALAVKARGAARQDAGESDAAEREEFARLKQQADTLKAAKAELWIQPEPEPELDGLPLTVSFLCLCFSQASLTKPDTANSACGCCSRRRQQRAWTWRWARRRARRWARRRARRSDLCALRSADPRRQNHRQRRRDHQGHHSQIGGQD